MPQYETSNRGLIRTMSAMSRDSPRGDLERVLKWPTQAATDKAASAHDFAQSIIDTIREPLLVLNADLR